MSTSNPPSLSARAWSVAKLTSLKFEGDADALAAYVDALVENNREIENGDPVLLRDQATTDLADFLGKDAAEVFVDALMKYLEEGDAGATKNKSVSRPVKDAEELKEEAGGIKGGKEGGRKQSVISRLGDRIVEPARGAPRERPHKYASPRGGRGDRDRMDRSDGRDRERGDGRHDRIDRERSERERTDHRDRSDVRDRLGAAPIHRGSKRGRELEDDRHIERDIQRRRGDGGERKGGEGRHGALGGRRDGRKDDDKIVQGVPPPFGFPPPLMTPEMMMKFPPPFPPGMLPPHPLIPPGAVVGREGRGAMFNGNGHRETRDRGGRDRGRGWEGREHENRGREGRGNISGGGLPRSGTHGGHEGKGSRGKYSVLVMRNVPDDKLKLPHILKFFEKYGTPDNVQLVAPDRAFIIYASREPAVAAVNSVDAIMGNRHIKLGWASAKDYDIANLELTEDGVLKPRTNGRPKNERKTENLDRKGENNKQENGTNDGGLKNAEVAKKEHEGADGVEHATATKAAAKELDEKKKKAAEEDLRRKRQAIAEARAKQEEEKASLQAKKKQLVEDQKRLFVEMETATEQGVKLDLLRKAKGIEAELKQVVVGLNPNAASARQARATEASTRGGHGNWASRGRGRGGTGGTGGRFQSFSVDNRPKTLQIMGATAGISVENAKNVFHETSNAEKVGGFWMLRFTSRRAAESALRARGPLRRGFGAGAMAQIVAENEGTKSTEGDPEGGQEGAEGGEMDGAGNEVGQVEENEVGRVEEDGMGGQEDETNAMMIDSDSAAVRPMPAQAIVE